MPLMRLLELCEDPIGHFLPMVTPNGFFPGTSGIGPESQGMPTGMRPVATVASAGEHPQKSLMQGCAD